MLWLGYMVVMQQPLKMSQRLNFREQALDSGVPPIMACKGMVARSRGRLALGQTEVLLQIKLKRAALKKGAKTEGAGFCQETAKNLLDQTKSFAWLFSQLRPREPIINTSGIAPSQHYEHSIRAVPVPSNVIRN